MDWKRKLSSRKFWAALAGFVTAVLVAFNVSEMSIAQIASVISALGVLVAYIIGESYIDGKSVSTDNAKFITNYNGPIAENSGETDDAE